MAFAGGAASQVLGPDPPSCVVALVVEVPERPDIILMAITSQVRPTPELESVELVESYRMKHQEVRPAKLLVVKHQVVFREKWHEYFGT